MKVSIITTIYKAEKDLPRLLDSMMALKSPELEFFLIDNGSPDRCGEICAEYAVRDKRFVIRTLKDNIGYVRARNLGLQEVNSDYVGFCDSDDFLEPDGYDDAIEKLKQTNCDFYITAYNEISGSTKRRILPPFRVAEYKGTEKEEIILPQLFGFLPGRSQLTGFVWKHIYKHSIIKNNGILFRENLLPYEDEIFNIDVANQSKTIVVDDCPIYNYVNNPQSITKKMINSFNLSKEWERIEQVYSERKIRISEGVRTAFYNAMLDYFYTMVLWAIKTNKKSVFKLASQFRRTINQDIVNDVDKNCGHDIRKEYRFLIFCLQRRWYIILITAIQFMLFKKNK